MEYEVIHDREIPDCCRVEAIDADGQCRVAIFTGSDAEERAREYAMIRNNRRAITVW
jgi:hypothetical protein